MTAAEILEHRFAHVAVATGAAWRADGVGRVCATPIPIDRSMEVLTPDDLLAGRRPEGKRIVLFDDDHYYLGGVLAEMLAAEGSAVTLVTPAPDVSHWTHFTLEQHRIQARLLESGVEIVTGRAVTALGADHAATTCVYTGRERPLPADAVVLVTSRLPNEQLHLDFQAHGDAWADAGLRSVRPIGDARAPATIAAAVWDGRRFAETLDGSDEAALYRRNVPRLEAPAG